MGKFSGFLRRYFHNLVICPLYRSPMALEKTHSIHKNILEIFAHDVSYVSYVSSLIVVSLRVFAQSYNWSVIISRGGTTRSFPHTVSRFYGRLHFIYNFYYYYFSSSFLQTLPRFLIPFVCPSPLSL
jgi:hypothetical protein